MNGLELLEWLKDIPEEELERAEVLLEVGADIQGLVTAKYYKRTFGSIYLINK